MIHIKLLRCIGFTLLVLILFGGLSNTSAQNIKFPNPRQEVILNQMKVLIWGIPESNKTTLTLRIHSGSAFDRQGKEGTMALLADILFPDEASRDYFVQDLGGGLEIESTFDYLQITVTSDPDQFLTAMQTLANAVINPEINKDTASNVRAAQLKNIASLVKDPVYQADQAAAHRLFGDFPYGHPQAGTVESLGNIDFADILFARERMLTADNATLVIAGRVDSDLAYRAVRRYFGIWTKSDEKSPANFRLPESPANEVLLIPSELEGADELRFAFRGAARNSKDYYASEILAAILQDRLPENEAGARVENHSYFLPGMLLFKMHGDRIRKMSATESQADLQTAALRLFQERFNNPVSVDEFNTAKSQLLSRFNPSNYVDLWLDVDTYGLGSLKSDYQNAQKVTLENVRALSSNWAKAPFVAVMLFHQAKPAAPPENLFR